MANPEPETQPMADSASLPRLWFELWTSVAFAPNTATEHELRRLRARWFAELGAVIEDSMRSAPFLEAMSRALWALNHSSPLLLRFWRPPSSALAREPTDAPAR